MVMLTRMMQKPWLGLQELYKKLILKENNQFIEKEYSMITQNSSISIMRKHWKNIIVHYSVKKIVWRNVFLYAFFPLIIGATYSWFSYQEVHPINMISFELIAAILAVIGMIMLKEAKRDTAQMYSQHGNYTEIEWLLGDHLKTNVNYIVVMSISMIMLAVVQNGITMFSQTSMIVAIINTLVVAGIINVCLVMMLFLKQFRAIYTAIYGP